MGFVPWSSQPLDEWAAKHAPGKFIDLDGHQTHYVDKGSGKPVVLVHGLAGDTVSWAKNIDALARSHRVLALDLWGFGYSSREPMDYGYPLYVRQVALFMQALGLERASFVGQSMGGGTCICLAVEQPDMVEKLVLVSPGGMPNPPAFAQKVVALPGIGHALLNLRTDAVRKLIMKQSFYYDPSSITREEFDDLACYQKIKGTNEVFIDICRRRFFDTLLPQIRQLGATGIPVLIVWGRQDRSIALQKGRSMHRLLPGARLEVFDRSGHMPHVEHPGRFNQLVLEFLG